MSVIYSDKGQAMPSGTVKIEEKAFGSVEGTEIRWLSGAGIMINSRGSVILIDPLLEGFDMPLLVTAPLSTADVKKADAVLITHIDNDHYSIPTCQGLRAVTENFHTTEYVASEMLKNDIPGKGHKIADEFEAGAVSVKLTPTLHNWQNYMPDKDREYLPEDYCGFYLHTPDGKIWLPGDSKLLEEQLHMETPDVILFDFSDNDWHIGFEGAVKLANVYPDAKLICIHWGTVDAPDFTPFNADPNKLREAVENPERVIALCPGEAFTLRA